MSVQYLIKEIAVALGSGISNLQVASSEYCVFCRYNVTLFLSALSVLFLLQ